MHSPDPLLVLRAQAGDRDALDALLRHCLDPLRRYVASMAGDAADDVLQETLFRIARKLRWLSDVRVFRAWAYRIASREALRHLGRIREEVELTEIAVVDEEKVDVEGLRDAVQTLSPASRAVLTLHYFEELPLDEVAAALEIPLGTVKSRLAYGLTQLRRQVRR